jgi:raffinose/stachyose/melibiose transport system substrate-binding protein
MEYGDTPDLFCIFGSNKIIEYAKAGLLKDITEDIREEKWNESFSKGVLDVFSYRGKYYGLPFSAGIVGIWYNKRIFKDLGLSPFTTWEEFINTVKVLKMNGYTPIALGAGDKWTAYFWWSYLALRIGGKDAFYKAYDGEGSFEDAPFVRAGYKLKELINLEPFQNGYLNDTYGDQAALIVNREAVMELMGRLGPICAEGE